MSSSRGFAAMDPDKQREIASKGGQARAEKLNQSDDSGMKGQEYQPEGQDETGSGGRGRQGFASMDKNQVREIAHQGGVASGEARRERAEQKQ